MFFRLSLRMRRSTSPGCGRQASRTCVLLKPTGSTRSGDGRSPSGSWSTYGQTRSRPNCAWRVGGALQGVSGVMTAEEQDRETWFVTGRPSGRALAEAAATVVDEFADRTRAYYDGQP